MLKQSSLRENINGYFHLLRNCACYPFPVSVAVVFFMAAI